jgi:very-short-patch-repair endonuclease
MHRFKQRAQRLRSSQTSAEARLWQGLPNRRLAKWKFRRQHAIDRFVVDFVSLDGKLVIEVDGTTHTSRMALSRDAERTSILEALGFRVVRVGNPDVYDNLEGVLEMIGRELGSILPTPLTRFRQSRDRPLPTGERC